MTKRTIWNASKYALAVGLLIFVVWWYWSPTYENGRIVNPGLSGVLQQPVHVGPLLLAIVLCLAGVLITFVRWYILVRAVKLPFRLIDAVLLGFVGLFFNVCMPGAVGGDIIKAAFLAREQGRRTVAVATVVMDRAIALWALFGFVSLSGTLFWACGLLEGNGAAKTELIIKISSALVAASVVTWLGLGFLSERAAERFAGRLGRLPKVGVSAAEFWRAVWMYRCHKTAVLTAIVLTCLGMVMWVLVFYFSVLSFWNPTNVDEKIPTLAQHFLIVPVGLVVQALPISVGGMGVGELIFGKLYKWLDCTEANGIIGSLVQRAIMAGLGVVGYLAYVRVRPLLAAVPQPAPELEAAEA